MALDIRDSGEFELDISDFDISDVGSYCEFVRSVHPRIVCLEPAQIRFPGKTREYCFPHALKVLRDRYDFLSGALNRTKIGVLWYEHTREIDTVKQMISLVESHAQDYA